MMTSSVKFGIQIIVTMLLSGVLFSATAAPQKCTREDAIKAETNASSLKTWHDLFESFRRYKQCDDGAISEGYSASVANLLAVQWKDVGDLIKLSNAHPDFKRFVLHHIDETMGMEQGKAIEDNVNNNCPVEGARICNSIKSRFVELRSK